ncbi:MAG: TetR/AcrR family transcriptional regulator [Bacteroidetes bacterium]|nr:TetR/AcrR family transcriptional regulator [Bacteroidota bacterium]
MKKEIDTQKDKSTEEKIKKAAEKIFLERGFSASRTRDIADEAGINLALLNYYFRSKKNLYNIIMMEKLDVFFNIIIEELKDNAVDLNQKMSELINKYTDLLIKEPRLPLFIMSEIQQNPDFFTKRMNIKMKVREALGNKPIIYSKSQEDDLQLLLSLLGVTIFPFIIRHSIQGLFNMTTDQYNELLYKRREMIPKLMNELYNQLNADK